MTEPADDELSSTLGELFQINPQRAEELWNEFFPRLIRLARKKLANISCRSFDEEDVALSAMKSFYRGRFDQLDCKDEMWRLLATITVRKATAQRRRLTAAKRGGGDVRGESVFGRTAPDDNSLGFGIGAIVDERRMPETTDQILKTCEDLLAKLPDEKLRRSAIMRLEGYSNQEISDVMRCSVARTKQRIARIRELWLADDDNQQAARNVGGSDSRPAAVTAVIEQVQSARQRMPAGSSELIMTLALAGLTLLKKGFPSEAEPILRECLQLRRQGIPTDWRVFGTQSLLGASLLGQHRLQEAEHELLVGCNGLVACEPSIPAEGKIRLTEAVECLVQLYAGLNKPAEMAIWKSRLEDYTRR